MTIRVFRANTGSCGACDAHIMLAISQQPDMESVASPLDADVWLLTGVLSSFTRTSVVNMLSDMHDYPPIVAVGQCALTGAPFGRGGIAEALEIPVAATLEGCPPTPAAIIAAIRAVI